MLNFKPFKGFRAKDENIQNFPIYSPEIYTEDQIKSKLREKHPSYIDIIKPTFFKGESPLENRFKKVRKRFEEYLNENLLEQDPASVYIYEQKKRNGEVFRGILGLISTDDFKNDNVKISEFTIEKKRKIFSQFLDITCLQTNPVLLTYESNSKLDMLMELEMKSKPIIQLIDELEITHKVWRVENRLKLAQFKSAIENLPKLYLADGHYRMSGAVAHADNVKSKHKKKDFLLENHYNVMSLLASNHSLKIYEYNRILKNLKGLSKEEFFEKLEKHFTVNDKGTNPYFPSHSHHISMYFENKFYGLYIKHEFRGQPEEGLGNVDVHLFNKFILEDIFNITNGEDEKEFIHYIKGTSDILGINAIKSTVDNEEFKVGFGFYPPSFASLQKLADLDEYIPIKTAYIEPKLLSGLIMYDMR